jgi:hypothetical protein
LLGAVWGAATAQQPAPHQCKLYNCACEMARDRRLYENDNLFKLAQACWCDLARFNVAERTEKAHGDAMRDAYAAARKEGKIVLYIGNTGG